jgi:trehalose 6-phosphate phosphatase
VPSEEVRRALAPLVADPGHSAIVTDFDGTLSPIVDDPGRARGLAGAADVLHRLARRFAVVAVVSGRPVSFLDERLAPGGRAAVSDPSEPGAAAAVRLVGLYGLEWSGSDGVVITEPDAEPWRPIVADTATRLRSTAPPGVEVEFKGLGVTVHWRRAPDAGPWAMAEVAGEERRTGLRAHPGRLSVELRPDLGIDKGTTTRRLVEGCSAACYLGDDLGDLPAYLALDRLAAEEGMATVSVAVVDGESAHEVAEAADVVVAGPEQALTLLDWLAGAAAAGT